MHSEENQNTQWSSLRPYDQSTSLVYKPSSGLMTPPYSALQPNSGLATQPSTALQPNSGLMTQPNSGLVTQQSEKSSSFFLPDRPRRASLLDRSSDFFMSERFSTSILSRRATIQENMTFAPDYSQADSNSVFNMMDSSTATSTRRNEETSYRPPPTADHQHSYRPPPAATAIDPDDVQARLLKLQNETGYDIVQRHGQRIYGGPPPDWEGELPGKGAEVYCYRIPRDCFEDELVPVFSRIGPIFELRLMIEFSGTNRTYCYVRYTKKEHATEAIRSVDGYEIRKGQHLAVTKSVDNRRLWINGIPKNRTAEEFKKELGAITSGISNVILYPSQTEANRTRSYMFVEYESHRAAALARRKLVPGKVFLFGVEVGQVDWAEPEPEVDEQQMKHIKILYVRHLDLATTEETIWTCFTQLSDGQVERVRKPKDFAFVHFTNRESAELVMSRVNPLYIDGQKVEVLWAKPPDKDYIAKKLDRQASFGQPPAASYDQPPAGPQNWSPAQILSAVCNSNNWGEPVSSPTWFYIDSLGIERGPFRPDEMWRWYKAGYFPGDLMVRRTIQSAFTRIASLALGNANQPMVNFGPPAMHQNVSRRDNVRDGNPFETVKEEGSNGTSVDKDRGIQEEGVGSFLKPKQEFKEKRAGKIKVKKEYVETEIKDEYIKPEVQDEYIKSVKLEVKDEYIQPEVKNEYIKTELKLEYIESEIKDEYIKPEVRDEYIKPEIRDEYIKPEIRGEFINSVKLDVKDEYIKPEVKNEYIKTEFKLEYIESEIKEESLKLAKFEKKMEVDNKSVYIGNVNYGATAEELEQHFHGCGSINRVTILINKYDGSPKGFAYMEFSDKDSVQTAMALDDSLFRGRQIKVKPKRTNKPGVSTTHTPPRGSPDEAQAANLNLNLKFEEKMEVDNRSVYIGNVDYGATDKKLERHFHGCGSINRVTILCNKKDGSSKGFAYVEFSDKDSVQTAMALDDSLFRGRQIKVMPKRTNKPGVSTTQTHWPPREYRGGYRGRGGFGSRDRSSIYPY